MIATLPELALKSAEPLLEALQSRPVASTPDEAEDLLFLVLQGRALFRRCWARALDYLKAGMSDEKAKLVLKVMVDLANVTVQVVALAVKASGQANATQLAEANEALREAQEIESAAREVFEFVSRAPAPVDREDLARVRAEWARGEGLEAEEMLARRKARKPA